MAGCAAGVLWFAAGASVSHVEVSWRASTSDAGWVRRCAQQRETDVDCGGARVRAVRVGLRVLGTRNLRECRMQPGLCADVAAAAYSHSSNMAELLHRVASFRALWRTP